MAEDGKFAPGLSSNHSRVDNPAGLLMSHCVTFLDAGGCCHAGISAGHISKYSATGGKDIAIKL